MRKADALSNRVVRESNQHRFTLFFTLTYNNENLPVYIEKDGVLIPNPHDDRLKDYPAFPVDVYKRPSKWSKNNSCFKDFPNSYTNKCFGVLSSVDVCNFKKRLRINLVRLINKYSNEPKAFKSKDLPLRFFIVGEYGPHTCRPHYHGLIWFDDEIILKFIKAAIYKSWKMCNMYELIKTISLVKSDAGRYVAGYLNFFGDLPRVLQQKSLRPFRRCSKAPAIGFYKNEEEKIVRSFLFGTMQTLRFDYKSQSIVPAEFPTYYLYKWFPKCKGFSKLSSRERYAIYSSCYPAYNRESAYIKTTGDISFFPSFPLSSSSLGNLYCSQNIRASKVANYICEKYNVSLDYYLYRLSLLYDYHIPQQKLKYQYETLSFLSSVGSVNYLPFYPLSFYSVLRSSSVEAEKLRRTRVFISRLGLSPSKYIDSFSLSIKRKSDFSIKSVSVYKDAVSVALTSLTERINRKLHNDLLTPILST